MIQLGEFGVEPGGVDFGEAVVGPHLRIALQDAGAVLVDVPAYVDAEHLSVETVVKSEDSTASTAKGHAKHRRSWCRVGCEKLMVSKPRVRQHRLPATEE